MQHNYIIIEKEQNVLSKNLTIPNLPPDFHHCKDDTINDESLNESVSDACIQRIMQFCRNIEIRNCKGEPLEWFNS